MAIKFLSGQTITGDITVSGNVQGATFNGLTINTTGTNNVANQIVRTQANGYANFGWINSISGNHAGTITRITASNDAYLRYVTPAQFRTGVTDGFYAPSSTVTGVTSVATGNGLTGGTIISTGTLTMASSYTGGFTFNTSVASPIHSGTVSTSGDGQNNYPFRLGSDYSAYMVAAASNTWGLFWAGNSGARYGTNGNGGPGNIWSNSTNPNEFCFVGGDSTRWSVQGSTGDTWQLGNIYLSGTFVRANNNLTLQVDGGGTPLNAITIDNAGTVTFAYYTYFPNYLFHAGDTNTRIQFTTGTVTLRGDTSILLDGPVTANESMSITGNLTAASASIPTMAGNPNFTGDIYQYGSIFRNASFIDVVGNRNSKIELETAYFTNTVSNLAVNIQFPNVAMQGYYKITLSGSYSNQDISGKLTKVIPFGYNPNGSIWRTGNSQSEITIATGGVSTNFTIGNLAWDSTNSKFIVPIYKLTSSGNSVRILIEYFGAAANNLKDVNLSSNYTQTAPSPFNVRQYQNIRDSLGIGTTSPANGKLVIDSTANQIAIETGTAGDGRLNIGHFSNGTFIGTYGDDGGVADNLRFGTHSGDTRMTILSGGNVGIGTNSPTSNLDIFSTGTSTLTLSYDGGGGSGSTIDFSLINAAVSQPITTQIKAIDDGAFRQDLSFLTKTSATGASGLSTRMTILANGNVGIGTAAPSELLEVMKDGGAIIRLHDPGNNSWKLKADTDFHIYDDSNSDYLTILNSGNVGIGVTSPQTNLHINNDTSNSYGTLRLEGSNRGGIIEMYNATYPVSKIQTDQSGNIGIYTSGAFAGSTLTEKLAITTLGNVAIGGTLGADSQFRVELKPAATILAGLRIGYNSTSNNYFDGDNQYFRNGLGSINRMSLNATALTVKGDVIAYGTPSDKRLKENIKPIESALDKVSKLQGVTFDWKKQNPQDDKELTRNWKNDIGFIAQDVQKVIPELVRENEDGMLSMRHQGIAPILLEAIKEQQKQIEDLQAQIKNISNTN